jgi:hypothetical protein
VCPRELKGRGCVRQGHRPSPPPEGDYSLTESKAASRAPLWRWWQRGSPPTPPSSQWISSQKYHPLDR